MPPPVMPTDSPIARQMDIFIANGFTIGINYTAIYHTTETGAYGTATASAGLWNADQMYS